jgi:hypothetical protein
MWLGLTQPTGSWVGQTDPVQFPLALSSLFLTRALSCDPNRHRRRLPILAASDDLRRRHLGQSTRPTVLYLLHQVDLADALSQRRSFALPGSRSASSDHLRSCCYGGDPHGACAVVSVGLVVTERHRWKHPRWVLPVLRRRHGWSPPQAAPGWPREHCLAMPTQYAPGRWWVRLPLFSLPLPSALLLSSAISVMFACALPLSRLCGVVRQWLVWLLS